MASASTCNETEKVDRTLKKKEQKREKGEKKERRIESKKEGEELRVRRGTGKVDDNKDDENEKDDDAARLSDSTGLAC